MGLCRREMPPQPYLRLGHLEIFPQGIQSINQDVPSLLDAVKSTQQSIGTQRAPVAKST